MDFDLGDIRDKAQTVVQQLGDAADDVKRDGLELLVDLGNRAQAKLDEMGPEEGEGTPTESTPTA